MRLPADRADPVDLDDLADLFRGCCVAGRCRFWRPTFLMWTRPNVLVTKWSQPQLRMWFWVGPALAAATARVARQSIRRVMAFASATSASKATPAENEDSAGNAPANWSLAVGGSRDQPDTIT